MALINRAELGIIVSQFGALWPIAQNRQEILRVCFKILLTGLVFAAIALVCYLTFYAVRNYKQDGQDEQDEALPVATTHTASRALSRTPVMATSPSATQRDLIPAPASPRQQVPSQRPAMQQLPFTPIPETVMISAHAINAQIEKEHAEIQSVGTIYGDTVVIPEERLDQQAAKEEKSLVSSKQQLGQMGDEPTPIYITITLLKTITMALHVPGSTKTYPVTLDDLNSKALQLIAYIARHQGKKVNLGDMRNDVFGNDDMDTNQVQESLNTAKREIRRRIGQAVERARNDFGTDVFPTDLDIFELAKKKYWLPAHCRVTDLAILEEQHQIIEQAETSNQLVNYVPDAVYKACMTLINTYSGDFIEDLLVDDPYAFDPPTDSWAREPFTLFRDYYLDAILYAAEYERKMADSANTPAQQREHYAEAGRLFSLGAMAACNKQVFDGMFDTKVFFSSKPGRRHGAHVLLSEQLIRRAIALYGKIGNTIVAKRVYATYEQQMHFVSNKGWTADPETLKDLEAAMQQTGAYRFPDQIASPYDLSSNLVGAESA
ncbi:hypothetical protein [Dictyobacter alpinus]|nr:hypothetical protein [Dictyobacter alpinus]